MFDNEITNIKEIDWSKCEEVLGYQFNNRDLLMEAFAHSSIKGLTGKSYQRLEFLGDGILRFFVSEQLFINYPQANEGDLTKAISFLVSETVLTNISKKIRLNEYIIKLTTNDLNLTNSAFGDIFESVTAAIYLDGGLDAVKKFLITHFLELILSAFEGDNNFKAILSEWAQKNQKKLPEYQLIESSGPAHSLSFKMQLIFDNNIYGPLIGSTKKATEQQLAKIAIDQLKLL